MDKPKIACFGCIGVADEHTCSEYEQYETARKARRAKYLYDNAQAQSINDAITIEELRKQKRLIALLVARWYNGEADAMATLVNIYDELY